MASTEFIDKQTVIQADWLNDVNDNIYGPTATVGLRADLANSTDVTKGASLVAGAARAVDVAATTNYTGFLEGTLVIAKGLNSVDDGFGGIFRKTATVPTLVDGYYVVSVTGGALIRVAQKADRPTFDAEFLKRFENKLKSTTGGNKLYIVGDSITEGSNTTDFATQPWAAMVRSAINQKYANTNQGFVSVRTLSGVTNFHTQTRSGFGADVFNAGLFGGVFTSSSVSGSFVEFTYTGRSAQVVYDKMPGNGTFSVTIDGVAMATIDSNGSEDRGVFSAVFTPADFDIRQHKIRITTTNNSPVNIMGIIYTDGYDAFTPVVMNVGRSSIAGSEFTNNMIDKYSTSGALIVALGVNDNLLTTSVTTFKANLRRFAQNNYDADGAMILLDFIFNDTISNVYKTAIKEVAFEFKKNVRLLDFSELWFADLTKNKDNLLVDTDNVHPTTHGHQRIADSILNVLGLSKVRQGGDPHRIEVLLNGGVALTSSQRLVSSLASLVGGSSANQAEWLNSPNLQVRAEVLEGGFWYDSGWYSGGTSFGVRSTLAGAQTTSTVESASDLVITQVGDGGTLYIDAFKSGGGYGSIAASRTSSICRLIITK